MSGPDFDSNTGCYTVSFIKGGGGGEGGRRHGNFVLVGGIACCNPTHTRHMRTSRPIAFPLLRIYARDNKTFKRPFPLTLFTKYHRQQSLW